MKTNKIFAVALAALTMVGFNACNGGNNDPEQEGNLALDKTKRASNQDASLDDEGHDAPDHSYSANPEEQAMQRDKVERVRRLMDQLPEKQRTCMQLRDVEGKSYKEIAAVMDITEQQVKINIFRARQSIKQEYLKQEQYGL